MDICCFPDTQVLLYYIEEYEGEDHKLSSRLISNLKTKKLTSKGYAVYWVNNEFNTIISDPNINKLGIKIVKIVKEDKSNSLPKLNEKIEHEIEIEDKPSTNVIISQLLYNIKKDNRTVDKSKIIETIYTSAHQIKSKREEINALLENCSKNSKLAVEYKKNKDVINVLTKELETIFPIKKGKDRRDNESIIEAAVFCKLLPMNSDNHFITNDLLRRPKDFGNALKEAKSKIKEILDVDISITKLQIFVDRIEKCI